MTKHYFIDNQGYWMDKGKVSNKEECLRFRKKWFNQGQNWPTKKEEILEAEMAVDSGWHTESDGRKWRRYFLTWDLTPEEIYECEDANNLMQYKFVFPELANEEKNRKNHWYQDCPYCQIQTYDLGAEKCPKCGRKVFYKKQVIIEGDEWTADL